MKTINTKIHHLVQIKAINGINPHRIWWDEIQGIEIHSNDDVVDGKKFYIVDSMNNDGETDKTIWYETPTTAAYAFHALKRKAISKA
jgi:hypothetical protein